MRRTYAADSENAVLKGHVLRVVGVLERDETCASSTSIIAGPGAGRAIASITILVVLISTAGRGIDFLVFVPLWLEL